MLERRLVTHAVPLRPSRRAALKTVVLGALIVGAGGALALFRSRGYVAPSDRTLLSLAPWELAVAVHAARRIVAPDRPTDRTIPSADDVDVVGFVDAYAARMSAPRRRDLSRAFLYLEQFAPLAVGLSRRFTELAPDEQDRVLLALESSPILLLRGAFAAVKSLVFMGYYRDARTWGMLGYDGPWVSRGNRGVRATSKLPP